MSENPYAPPRAELASPPLLAGASGTIDLGRCISEAWRDTWANFPLWLGAGLVGLLAMVGGVLSIIGIVAVVPVLFWGVYVFLLKMHDGGAQVGDLFSGFSRYGHALANMLGFFLVSVLLGVPGNALAQLGASIPSFWLIGASYVVSLAVGLLVSPRLQFAPFLMVDRNLGLGDALSESWRRTSELKLMVVLLNLLVGVAAFAGLLALILGVIPALVFGSLLWASAYRQLFGGARAS